MGATYLEKVLRPDKLAVVAKCVHELVSLHDADCIVVRGLSGQLAGIATSVLYQVPMAVVRKESEQNSHSGSKVEIYDSIPGSWERRVYKDYFIVDDLISSGSTVDAILDQMNQMSKHYWGPIQGGCLGIILYEKRYDTKWYKHSESGRKYPIFDISPKVRDAD